MRHPSWLTSAPPSVAIEIASRRVTVVALSRAEGRAVISASASEPVPPGLVSPALASGNIADPPALGHVVARALERAGLRSVRRAALVVPDSVARVSLLTFDEAPARQSDREQLVRWQIRKATPFPIEQARVADFTASTTGAAQSVAAVVARQDVIAEYEHVTTALGIHAGIVDLASFSVMNLVMGQGTATLGDWLLVQLAPEGTTLAILRGHELMFYRHRAAVDDEPLRSLVHQTAMYHEDRLGGGAFNRVLVAGSGADASDVRREISASLNVSAETVDVRSVADLADRTGADAMALDALPAAVGMLMRERKVA